MISPQTLAILSTSSLWQAAQHALLNHAIDTGRCPPSGHFDPGGSLEQAKSLLQSAPPGQPTFLWVHLTPPHDPYAPPAPYLGLFDAGPQARRMTDSSPIYHYMSPADGLRQRTRLMGRYDEAIRYVDDHVGGFLEWLRAQGRFDRSLIVITADHGESFMHDYGGHGGPELYDEIIHVPLLLKLPGQRAGQRVKALAEQADLLPTLSDLSGLQTPTGVEGQSLRGLLEGTSDVHPSVFSMTFERQSPHAMLQQGTVAMVDGPWKLHLIVGPADPTAPQPRPERLFNLEQDSHESRDVAGQHPDIVARMRTAIEQQLAVRGRALDQ